ncbi:MAG: hypothetical protein JXA81_06125 [Sedimentisphaerales bacterium]|nr:hypothetical protein [Sedimentisphaerales bacterium]
MLKQTGIPGWSDIGSGAKSDARRAPEAPKNPDLDLVVKAWPELPEHIKEAIKALIQTHFKKNT